MNWKAKPWNSEQQKEKIKMSPEKCVQLLNHIIHLNTVCYLYLNKKIILKNDNNLRDFWDNIKWNKIHIIEIPEEEERKKRAENYLQKIMAEKFLLGKETDIQVQESPRVLKKRNPNRTTPRYMIVKMAKVKESLKQQEKNCAYKGNSNKALSRFLSRNSTGQKTVA